MKKFLIFLTALNIILLVFAVVITIEKNYSSSVLSNSVNSVEVQDEPVSVSVTAVGDCTLGTDIKFGLAYTFDAEVKAQDNDYSYFFKNVKPYFEKDDLTIVNFEGTLSDGGARVDKQFAFRGAPEYSKELTMGAVEAATLANTHTKD